MNKKILILDSGIGGVSTLVEIRKKLPSANILYFADDEFLPYGDKSEQELFFHLKDVIERFENEVCGVVLACNTATGVAVEPLRQIFCFPIVGTEPAIVPACKGGKRALVLVTPLESVQRKFARLAKDKNIVVCAMADLAGLIDECLLEAGDTSKLCECELVCQRVESIEKLAKSQNIERIVLGCTHYVFLRHAGFFEEFLLFDGNVGVAKRAACFFENKGEGKTEFIFGSGNKKKSQTALRLLNSILAHSRFESDFEEEEHSNCKTKPKHNNENN